MMNHRMFRPTMVPPASLSPPSPGLGTQVSVQYQGCDRLGRVTQAMPELNMFCVEIIDTPQRSGCVMVTRGLEELRVLSPSGGILEEEVETGSIGDDVDDVMGDIDDVTEEMELDVIGGDITDYPNLYDRYPRMDQNSQHVYPFGESLNRHSSGLKHSVSSGYLTSSHQSTSSDPSSPGAPQQPTTPSKTLPQQNSHLQNTTPGRALSNHSSPYASGLLLSQSCPPQNNNFLLSPTAALHISLVSGCQDTSDVNNCLNSTGDGLLQCSFCPFSAPEGHNKALYEHTRQCHLPTLSLQQQSDTTTLSSSPLLSPTPADLLGVSQTEPSSIDRLTELLSAQLLSPHSSPLIRQQQQLLRHLVLEAGSQKARGLSESFEEYVSESSTSIPINIPGTGIFDQHVSNHNFISQSEDATNKQHQPLSQSSNQYKLGPIGIDRSRSTGWLSSPRARCSSLQSELPISSPVSSSATPRNEGSHHSSPHWNLEVTRQSMSSTSSPMSSSQQNTSPQHLQHQFASSAPSLQQSGLSSAVGRRIRSDVKKCRKVYGVDQRDRWCNQCKWKKACRRFPDPQS